MPKYYCDYCRSYLTHDSKSVRKSHLMGKNHIRYYCDYYEEQAKQLNKWEQSELPYEITSDDIYRGIPESSALKEEEEVSEADQTQGDSKNGDSARQAATLSYLPPPPALLSLPNPPPSVYHYDLREQKLKISDLVKEIQERNRV